MPSPLSMSLISNSIQLAKLIKQCTRSVFGLLTKSASDNIINVFEKIRNPKKLRFSISKLCHQDQKLNFQNFQWSQIY